ncbi:Atg20 protein [Maudiozyma humilis]|uniref:Autophagy-related protein 20 n=1 Tax=Maudiozyma humilis TaxID=51915 RepID=A0AAV5RQ90_MAUHU|nr:Atg20 protein [Kazachstania humilis]
MAKKKHPATQQSERQSNLAQDSNKERSVPLKSSIHDDQTHPQNNSDADKQGLKDGTSDKTTNNNSNKRGSTGSRDDIVTPNAKDVSIQEAKSPSKDIDIPSIEDDDDISIVEGRMVHTDIIETNNPFIEAQNHENGTDSSKSNLTATQRNQNIPNPNQKYSASNVDVDDDSLVASVSLQNPPLIKGKVPSKPRKLEKTPQTSKIVNKSVASNHSGTSQSIQILEVNKISEGQGRAYVAYSIKYGDSVVKRRYSDFESLRNILVKLFPITLIPPIPKKEGIKTYGKAIAGTTGSRFILPSEDMGSIDLSNSVIGENVPGSEETFIRHRIHMLTIFLNKVMNDPEVSKTSIITDFLEPNNVSWTEFVASSATFSSLPKSILNCNPMDPTNTSRIYVSLPTPSTTQLIIPKEVRSVSNGSVSRKDPFDVVEQEYKRYESLLSDGIYKHNKKITSSLYGLKNDYRDVSTAAGCFESPNNSDVLIERYLSGISDLYEERNVLLENLVSGLHYSVDEPFVETVGMVNSARDLIRFRKLKASQNDMIQKSLDSKKKQLTKLVAENSRFGHMDEAIAHEPTATQVNSQSRGSSSESYSGKLFNRFNKIASFVKDSVSYPEVSPSVAISDLKRETEELEGFLKVTRPDLDVITDVIQHEQLPKFQNENSEEVGDILKCQAKLMRAYAEKNLELWKQLKEQQNAL